MGFRFHKSLSLIPGLRLNFSKSGPSLSLGGKGATYNIGPRGTRATAGLPGSGLSYSESGRKNGAFKWVILFIALCLIAAAMIQ